MTSIRLKNTLLLLGLVLFGRCNNPSTGLDDLPKAINQQDVVCKTGVVCFKSPLLGTADYRAIFARAEDDVWMGTAATGAIWHFDGSEWAQTSDYRGYSIVGIYAVSSDEVWAVGTSSGNSAIWRWDGSSWKHYQGACLENQIALCGVDRILADLQYQEMVALVGHEGEIFAFANPSDPNKKTSTAYRIVDGRAKKFSSMKIGFRVRNAWESAQGELWLLGENNAVSYWNGKGDPVLTSVDLKLPAGTKLVGITGNNKGDVVVWNDQAGGEAKGFYHLHDKAISEAWIPLTGPTISSAAFDASGRFWTLRLDGSSDVSLAFSPAGKDISIFSNYQQVQTFQNVIKPTHMDGHSLNDGVWGVGDGGLVFRAGESLPEAQKFSNLTKPWTSIDINRPTKFPTINKGYSVSPNVSWLVGNDGFIAKQEINKSWQRMDYPIRNQDDIHDWFNLSRNEFAVTEMWMVGSKGGVLRYDHPNRPTLAFWQWMDIGTKNDLTAVTSYSTEVLFGGKNVLLYCTTNNNDSKTKGISCTPFSTRLSEYTIEYIFRSSDAVARPFAHVGSSLLIGACDLKQEPKTCNWSPYTPTDDTYVYEKSILADNGIDGSIVVSFINNAGNRKLYYLSFTAKRFELVIGDWPYGEIVTGMIRNTPDKELILMGKEGYSYDIKFKMDGSILSKSINPPNGKLSGYVGAIQGPLEPDSSGRSYVWYFRNDAVLHRYKVDTTGVISISSDKNVQLLFKKMFQPMLETGQAGTLWAVDGNVFSKFKVRWEVQATAVPNEYYTALAVSNHGDPYVAVFSSDQTSVKRWDQNAKNWVVFSDVIHAPINALKFWKGRLYAAGDSGTLMSFQVTSDGGLTDAKNIVCPTYLNIESMDGDDLRLVALGEAGSLFEIQETSCKAMDVNAPSIRSTGKVLLVGGEPWIFTDKELCKKSGCIPLSQSVRGSWSDGKTVFVAGPKGFVASSLNGTAWISVDTDVMSDLVSVWGDVKNHTLWILGKDGLLLQKQKAF